MTRGLECEMKAPNVASNVFIDCPTAHRECSASVWLDSRATCRGSGDRSGKAWVDKQRERDVCVEYVS